MGVHRLDEYTDPGGASPLEWKPEPRLCDLYQQGIDVEEAKQLAHWLGEAEALRLRKAIGWQRWAYVVAMARDRQRGAFTQSVLRLISAWAKNPKPKFRRPLSDKQWRWVWINYRGAVKDKTTPVASRPAEEAWALVEKRRVAEQKRAAERRAKPEAKVERRPGEYDLQHMWG